MKTLPAAGVPQPAAAGFCPASRSHHAAEALPDASHVHHGVTALLQTGLPLLSLRKDKTLRKSDIALSDEAVLTLYLSSCQLFGWIGERLKHQSVVLAVIAMMAVQGVANLQAQWAIIGEFSNLPQEELLDWIQENTRPGKQHCLA